MQTATLVPGRGVWEAVRCLKAEFTEDPHRSPLEARRCLHRRSGPRGVSAAPAMLEPELDQHIGKGSRVALLRRRCAGMHDIGRNSRLTPARDPVHSPLAVRGRLDLDHQVAIAWKIGENAIPSGRPPGNDPWVDAGSACGSALFALRGIPWLCLTHGHQPSRRHFLTAEPTTLGDDTSWHPMRSALEER